MRFCGQCGSSLRAGIPAGATRVVAPATLTATAVAPPLTRRRRGTAPLAPHTVLPPNGHGAAPARAPHRPQPDREPVVADRPVSAEFGGVFGGIAPAPNGFDSRLVPMMDERKLVTVVFGDISGFVQLAEQLDPEEVKAVMDQCLRRLAEEVERYEGRVDKFLGDNIMAIFGAPRAHEDDAERAVRCALEMQAAVRDLSVQFERLRGFPLELHVGINTGEVLAGRMGADRDQDYTVMGDAVNLAARLQHAAGAGEILIGEATYRATAPVIEYRSRGTIQVRGKREPVSTWEVVRVKARRGNERGLRGLEARLVGRDSEFTLLKTLFRRVAQERQLQQVLVLGAAGVGKSRLLWELEKYLDGLPQEVYFRKGRCLPYGPGVGFRALAEIIKTQCGILDDDPHPVAETKLRATVQQVFSDFVSTTGSLRDLLERQGGSHALALAEAASTADVAAITHWLGVVLGLRPADDGTAIDPETVKEELFWALRRFFARLAASLPLVLAFEDIHWADSILLQFIEQARESLAHLPILILSLARPEMAQSGSGAAWVARAQADRASTTLALAPLPEVESRVLIHELLSNDHLPPAFEELVLRKAEGNPFFVEEIMRILIDSGTLVYRDSAWEVVKPLESARIPDTIQALVGARLDALPELEKRVIQGASVIGRIFWLGAVDDMFPQISRGQVQAALDMLESREFIVSRGNPTFAGDAEYSFRNVLTRDVAYNSLPKALRGDAHAHVAAWIEAKAGDRLREFADLLAYHYEQALALGREMMTLGAATVEALEDKAIRFLEAAGDVASERQALAEAEQYYWRALEIMGASDRFPADGAPGPLQGHYLSVLGSHAGVVAGLEDYPRALAELNTVIDQARTGPTQPERARALLKRAEVLRHQGDVPGLEADARAALSLFRTLQDRPGQAEAHLLLGLAHRHDGDADAARQAFEQALALFHAHDDQAADRRGEARVMRELGLIALNRDEMAAADAHMTAALAAFRQLGDRREVATCLRSLALVHSFAPDLRRFQDYAQGALALERELGHKHGEAMCLVTLGFVSADRRQLEQAEAYSQEAASLLHRLGDRRAAVWAWRVLGIIAAQRGQPAAARAHYEQALEQARAGSIRALLPELYRRLAEVALAEGDAAGARAWATQGTTVALADCYSQGTTWRALGLAQRALGEGTAARTSLETSLAALPAAIYPLEHARSCSALAACLDAQGAQPAADALRATAAALLDRLVWADGMLPPAPDLLLRLASGPAGTVP
jgi:class 3 adenylate cyclase/tetratricopeptide (TPR) repeat protein